MRINEVLNSKHYITEEDTMTLADVQVMYGDDPVMMAAITRAKMLPKIQTWDQAIDKASAEMRLKDKKNKGDKPKRDFATNTMKDFKPSSEVRKSDRKRGAQLGNQNARKNFGGDIIKGLQRAKDVMTKGTLGDVGTAASVGSDIASDTFGNLDKIALTKDPKSRGQVFGS